MDLVGYKTDVIIDETIYEIKTHAGFLRLYSDKNEILSDVPIYQINSVLIEGGKINIPASLIKLCCQEKIPIHILTNKSKHFGSLHFALDDNIENRRKQFEVLINEDWRLYLAKQILHQKILIQKKMAQLWQDFDIAEDISNCLEKISNKVKFQSLMGTEGRAAILYWQVFGQKLSKIQEIEDQIGFDIGDIKLPQDFLEKNKFVWIGRGKHPTIDPINSMLSLGYGLLATQCQTSLTLKGLDPYLGILHKTSSERPALTFDIMEVYRSLLVDLWVLGLVEKKVFMPQDFTFTQEGICTLLPHKKNEFFRLWYKRFKYYQFDTNFGKITLNQFLTSNTNLLIDWFDKICEKKERNTGRFDRFGEKMIIFEDIDQFSFIE